MKTSWRLLNSEVNLFSDKVNSVPQKIKKFIISKEEKKVVLKFKKSQISTAEVIKAFVGKKFKL